MLFIITVEAPENQYELVLDVFLLAYDILNVQWQLASNPSNLKAVITLKPKTLT